MKITIIIILFYLFYSSNSIKISQQFDTKYSLNYNKNVAEKCEKDDGKYQQQGLLGSYICIKKYKDANKICNSSNDCQGQCIIEDQYNPIAFCKEDNNPYGCYSTIEQWTDKHQILCRD